MIQLDKVLSLKDKDKLAITIHYSTLVAIAVFIPYHFILKNWNMFIYDSLAVFILGLISVAYVKKQIFIGKVLTLSGTMIYIYLLSFIILAHETRSNLFFFLLAISAIVVFDYGKKRERISIMIFSIMNVALVILSEIVTFEPIYELSKESIKYLRVADTVVFAIMLVVLLSLYNMALHRAEMELLQFANIDMLTGIYNRRKLLECGRERIKKNKEAHKESVVIIFDIDYFKQINDQYGHLAGDRVLSEMSQMIQKKISEEDVFGRYGGEEFVLISEGTRQESKALAEMIRTSIEGKCFTINEDTDIMVTVSLGVCIDCDSDRELEVLIDKADKVLYEAKAMGRNKTIIVDS